MIRICEECGSAFERDRGRFCSDAHRYRARDRARYAADPDGARARARAYYAANRAQVSARAAARNRERTPLEPRACELQDCGRLFVPLRRDSLFCSRTHYERDRSRRRRAS